MISRVRLSALNRSRELMIRLWPSQSDSYTRFIILCHPRTGSTLLHTYLNSHWNILSYGDLLSRDKAAGDQLEKYIKRDYPQFIKAVGMKFFYQYESEPWGIRILNDLIGDKDLRIIHLKRKDHFRSAISYELAKITGHWSFSTKTHKAVFLDPDQVIKNANSQKYWETYYDERFASHEQIQVSYEKLVSDPVSVLRDVQKFLHVDEKRLKSVLRQQHGMSLRDYVANFDELLSAFGESV